MVIINHIELDNIILTISERISLNNKRDNFD